MNTSNIYCRQIIDLLYAHGIRTVFCSPGSRNAPLLIALAMEEEMISHVVVDERSAAFRALGWSLVKKEPVALICTSGTAILNYAPAIAEAYYSGVPLIVVSADRPKEWIDQDDSQTIRQFGVLSHIVKGSYDVRAIPEGGKKEYTDEVKWTVNRTVNEALINALTGKPGPVHINVQLSDPLGLLSEHKNTEERLVRNITSSDRLHPEVLKRLAEDVCAARVMIVAGFGAPDHHLDKSLRIFANYPNVVVMAETLANLHDPQPFSTMIDSVLCDLTDEQKEALRPDIVISFGGALVSRMLKQYLRQYPPRKHWSIGHSNYFCDCFQSLSDRIDITPASFFRQLWGAVRKNKINIKSQYAAEWSETRQKSAILTRRYIDKSAWSDLKALDYVFNNLTFDNLFLSNGTVVRYAQIVPHICHAEYCNRGVSGIDGSTSTAVGGAYAYKGRTTLISGDMSWLYDSGASALNDVPLSMRMVVIDNSGGGIFRFIKSTSSIPEGTLDRYFCVEDLADVAAIAAAFGIEVQRAEDMDSLEAGVKWLSEESDYCRLLLVVTPPVDSAEILTDYFNKNR